MSNTLSRNIFVKPSILSDIGFIRHSRGSGARSEAPALSSLYKYFWTPVSTGVTGFWIFYEIINFIVV
jgi:hypothetical protein